jgi:hypothetical protein
MSLATDANKVHRVSPLHDSQLDDVTRALEKFFHVRTRGADDLILTQGVSAELEKAQSQAVAIRRRFDETRVAQFGDDPVHGRLGQTTVAVHETQRNGLRGVSQDCEDTQTFLERSSHRVPPTFRPTIRDDSMDYSPQVL